MNLHFYPTPNCYSELGMTPFLPWQQCHLSHSRTDMCLSHSTRSSCKAEIPAEYLVISWFNHFGRKWGEKKTLFPHFLNGYVQFVRNWGPDSSHFTAATSSPCACCLQSSLESWISTLLPQTASAKVWHLPRWAADTLHTLLSPRSCPNPHLQNSRAILDTGDGSHVAT